MNQNTKEKRLILSVPIRAMSYLAKQMLVLGKYVTRKYQMDFDTEHGDIYCFCTEADEYFLNGYLFHCYLVFAEAEAEALK